MRLRFKIKGCGLLGQDARMAYHALRYDQPLSFRREPDNAADPNAVIVLDKDGRPCGYVEAKIAAQLAPLIDAGAEFTGMVSTQAHATQYAQGWTRKKR